MTMVEVTATTRRRIQHRLVPLQVAVCLQNFGLWVPVEKLFMTQIGFTPRSVAVMAGAYAAVVPLLEVPSGILADRWSRNRILVCASAALLASTLLAGLSTNVPTYIAAAMILGVYFALSSGTVDSVVYDVLIEETGTSDGYENWIGRIHIVESGALVVSALGGGVLAGWISLRLTYFATLPFVAVAIVAFLRFHEPRLHQTAEHVTLRSHVALTYRTLLRDPGIRQVVLLGALVGLLSQAVLEFGPLWLVALTAPAWLFGPYWAAIVSTLGIGGYLSGRLNLDHRVVVCALAVASPAAAIVLTVTRALAAMIVAQVVLALLLAVIGIRAGKLLHDGVPSNLRAGVSSGVGTFSWLLFLPFSLVFGWFARMYSVPAAGWFLVGAAALIALLLVTSLRRPATVSEPAEAIVPGHAIAAGEEIACRELVELVTDYLEGVLPSELGNQVRQHLDGCGGCAEYIRQIRLTIEALRHADLQLIPRSSSPGPANIQTG